MPQLHDLLLLPLLLAVLLMGLGWWWSSRKSGRASRRRNARAQSGESDAEALLHAHGFTVLDRQVRRWGTMWVDGEPVDFEVRADLMVERDGRSFVAEVKTGERAPDPLHPPTRRQLHDYWHLFGDCGLLLVDMEAGRLVRISFEG